PIVCSPERQGGAVEIGRCVLTCMPLELTVGGGAANKRRCHGRHDDERLGPARQERTHLGRGHLAATDDDDPFADEVEEGGEIGNAAVGGRVAGHKVEVVYYLSRPIENSRQPPPAVKVRSRCSVVGRDACVTLA